MQQDDIRSRGLVTLQSTITHTVFESPEPWVNAFDPVLIITCSDPRFMPHHGTFIQHHLGLVHPVHLSVPGGPATILPSSLSRQVMLTKIGLHAAKHRPERVVGVAHGGSEGMCEYYRHHYPIEFPQDIRHRQLADLIAFRSAILEVIPRASVDLYYVEDVGRKVVFSSLG